MILDQFVQIGLDKVLKREATKVLVGYLSKL